MRIFLLSGTMGAFEIVDRDFIRHAYSKRSFSLVLFHVLFFFFPFIENALRPGMNPGLWLCSWCNWTRACSILSFVTSLATKLNCSRLTSFIKAHPTGRMTKKSFSSPINSLLLSRLSFWKKSPIKKYNLFIFTIWQIQRKFWCVFIGELLFMDIFLKSKIIPFEKYSFLWWCLMRAFTDFAHQFQ